MDMSKRDKQAEPTASEINIIFNTRDSKDIETSVPYIKQASINHTLEASVANSGFTIVLPQMDSDLGSLFFTIGGRAAYISAVVYPHTAGKETVDQISRDRICEAFVAGDKIRVFAFVLSDNGLERGTPSEEITII